MSIRFSLNTVVFLCLFHLTLGLATSSPSAKPTVKPTAKPTAKPTVKPTVKLSPAPTRPDIVGEGWYYTSYFETASCTGPAWKVAGNKLNECLDMYQDGGFNHTSRTRIGVEIIGHYMFKTCVPGVSAVYEEYGPTDHECTGPVTKTQSYTGDCVKAKDPNSADYWYIKAAQCQLGLSLPQMPSNSVLETQVDNCKDNNEVAFTATTTTKCSLNSQASSWNELFSLSNQMYCNDQDVPMINGYLGTHCTTKSNSVQLPTSCTGIPGWEATPYATGSSYSCTPRAALSSTGSGWMMQTHYENSDCTGAIISTTGQAIGVCSMGFNNESVAIGSMETTCDGTRYYQDTTDCTGLYTLEPVAAGGCVSLAGQGRGGPGRGDNGQSYRLSCLPFNPTPWGSAGITQFQYDNDMCYGSPNSFTTFPQDNPFSSINNLQKAYALRAQSVSCSSGKPVLTHTFGGDSSPHTTFTQYLDTSCSFIDPAYTASMMKYGPPSQYNSKGLVFYRSQVNTGCTISAPAPTPTDPLAFPKPEDGHRYGGAIAGIVIALLIACCTIGGIYYWFKHYYIASYGENTRFLNSGATSSDMEARDDIPKNVGIQFAEGDSFRGERRRL